MSMNRYGVIAQRHWAQWLPRQYATISNPDSFFTTLGEEVARQIDDLTDELVSEIRQSDSYLAHVGRLFAARAIAEELILPQRVLPDPELAAADQDGVPPESRERPMVVDRDHPEWAEVDAEQRERVGNTDGRERYERCREQLGVLNRADRRPLGALRSADSHRRAAPCREPRPSRDLELCSRSHGLRRWLSRP